MYALPLPTQIGATKVTRERVAGPPSKVYPALRDLIADRAHSIAVELDTEKGRKQGLLIQNDKPAGHLWFRAPLPTQARMEPVEVVPGITQVARYLGRRVPTDPTAWAMIGSQAERVEFDKLIAFRVLAVLVRELPGSCPDCHGESLPGECPRCDVHLPDVPCQTGELARDSNR